MSSILDALKKLEEEKAARHARESMVEEPFNPKNAAEELFGEIEPGSVAVHNDNFRLTKWTLLFGGSFMLLMFGLVIGLATWVIIALTQVIPAQTEGSVQVAQVLPPNPELQATVVEVSSENLREQSVQEISSPDILIQERSSPAEAQLEISPIEPGDERTTATSSTVVSQTGPERVQILPQPVIEAQTNSQDTLGQPANVASTTNEQVPVQVPVPVRTQNVSQEPIPESPVPITPPPPRNVASITTQTASTYNSPEDNIGSAVSSGSTSESKRNSEPVPDNLRSLPQLRNTERNRHGLEGMRINMLREPSDSRPNALAIINLNRVFVGERIPDTNARLIGVEARGIAIEILDSQERYFVDH